MNGRAVFSVDRCRPVRDALQIGTRESGDELPSPRIPAFGQWACAHSTSSAISPIPRITRANLIKRSWSWVGMG